MPTWSWWQLNMHATCRLLAELLRRVGTAFAYGHREVNDSLVKLTTLTLFNVSLSDPIVMRGVPDIRMTEEMLVPRNLGRWFY